MLMTTKDHESGLMGQCEPKLAESEVNILKPAEKLGFDVSEISELGRLYNSKEMNK